MLFTGSRTGKPIIPPQILDLVTGWIQDDPRLCLTSLCYGSNTYTSRTNLWTSPTKHNTQTPIPGLVSWCTKAPVLLEISTRSKQQKMDSSLKLESQDMSQTWSKLHLGVLQSILGFPALPGSAQLELVTLADMRRIVSDVTGLMKLLNKDNEQAKMATHRLLQVLQVSLATGGFRCSLGKDPKRCNCSL